MMIKIILHGANGYMGRVIESLAAEDPDIEIAAGIDVVDDGTHNFPVFTDINACDVTADVVIDFSVAPAVDGLISFCEERSLPVVICTTGLSDEQISSIDILSKNVAVLRSGNMSLGINALLSMVKKAARVFMPAGFEVEIIEKHHNRKLDAPSGTALMLADAVNDASDEKMEYVYDRSGRREKRSSKEIGISSIRGGNIVGIHEVMFAGTDEILTFTHQATSRAVFGNGAIAAAKFLVGRRAGLYDMLDVVAVQGG